MARTVLIVEDEPEVARLLRDVLTEAGFAVVLSTGSAAMSTATQVQPDVMVVDYVMPGMTGADVMRGMRAAAERPLPPIVLVTGRSEAEDLAEEMGADAFLRKPFDVDELVNVVQHLTEGQ